MAYRSAPERPPPRVLVVRPQRATTSFVFLVVGVVFAVVPLAGAVSSLFGGGPTPVLPALFAASFGALFALVGLHGWLLEVRLAAYEDGALTMTWKRWPLAATHRELALADVTDVTVEDRGSTSRIVVVAAGERIPLTGSSTSDDVSSTVHVMRAFLELDRDRS